MADEKKMKSEDEQRHDVMVSRARELRLSLTEIPKAWIAGGGKALRPLTSQLLSVERSIVVKPHRDVTELAFGRDFSDHMMEVEWDVHQGWAPPRIVPYHDMLLHPAVSVLHYCLEIFDGLKAFLDDAGHVRVFRPMAYFDRMAASCKRIALPEFDAVELFECVKKLLSIDRSWVPAQKGYSLYIRPSLFAIQPTLGVAFPQKCKMNVICSPVGPYFKQGFAPIKVLCDTNFCRAWAKGTGNVKFGGNFGCSIMPMAAAQAKGLQEVLWVEPALDLPGEEFYITEAGAMNVFFRWKNAAGEDELVTPPLEMGTVMPGVLRDSVLSLVKKWNEIKVNERRLTISDIVKAIEEGKMIEAFATSTACVVIPIAGFEFQNKFYETPIDKELNGGKLAHKLLTEITEIQYGRSPSEWSVLLPDPPKQEPLPSTGH